MAIQPFSEVLQDPRFQELPTEKKLQATEDYWATYQTENPDSAQYAFGQLQGSKELLNLRSQKSQADPITARVLGYQEDVLSSRLTVADADNEGLFKSTADRDLVLERERERLESTRSKVEDLVKTHEANLPEATKRNAISGFLGGGSAKSLAGFGEGAYQSAKDALNDWSSVSDGVAELLMETDGDIDKAISLSRDKLKGAEASAALPSVAMAPGGAFSDAAGQIMLNQTRSKFGEAGAKRLEELKTSLDAAGVPSEDRSRVIKDAALSTAWSSETKDRIRSLSNGELVVNPGRVFGDVDGLNAEIDKSGATNGQKELAKINVSQMRDKMAGKIFANASYMDDGFEAFANQKINAGEQDRAKILDEWSARQKDRNWLFQKAPDAIWEGIKTGAVGIEKTVVGTGAGVASLWGGGQGLAELQANMGDFQDRSAQAAELRGLNEEGLGVTRDLTNSLTQMAPMFAGGGLAAGLKGVSQTALAGASVYGWAAAQGYESKLSDAVNLEQQRIGRELSGEEMTQVLGRPSTQVAAFANGAQTALLAKVLGSGTERVALGQAAESMTVRDFLTKGGQAALKDGTLRKELQATAGTIFKDAGDEFVEESLNQVFDKAISIGALGESLKMGDLLEETFKAGLQGAAIGGGIPQVTSTAPIPTPELEQIANANLVKEATSNVVAPTLEDGGKTAGQTRREAIENVPDLVPAEPPSTPETNANIPSQLPSNVRVVEPADAPPEPPEVSTGGDSGALGGSVANEIPANDTLSEPAPEPGVAVEQSPPAQSIEEPSTSAETEVESPPAQKSKRSITNKDLQKVSRIADSVTRGQNNASREAALNAITDQLIKDPDTSPALLTKIGKQAAGTRGVRTAEREARAAGEVGTLDTGLQEADTAATPDKVAVEAERASQLSAAMKTLTPVERAAIQGKADGKTSEQIAREVGTSPGTIDNAASRARPKLRKMLAEDSVVPFHENNAPEPTKAEASKSDQQVVADLLPALAKATGRTVTQLGQMMRPTGKKLSKSQQTAKQIGEFFGRRVVYVSGIRANGLNLRSQPGTIVLSDSANRAETLVVYHELVHSLAATDKAAYQKLKDTVKVDLDAYTRKFKTRQTGDPDATNEEFLADFVADRATDPEFWEGLARQDRPLFERVANLLRSILKSVTAGRFGTEQFVKDLKAADEAVRDALNTLRLQTPEQVKPDTSDEVKTEKPEKPDRVQTAGTENLFVIRKPADYETAEASVARTFNHATADVDANGVRRATRFLASLTNPKTIARLQKQAEAQGVKPEDSFIVAGMARGAVVAYAARLAETDYKAAERLIHKLYKLSSDIGFLFPEGTVNATTIGKALRSLRSYEGGSIIGLFNSEGQGRADFVKKKHGEAVVEESKAISAADVTGQAAEDLADDIVAQIDPDLSARVAEAEKQARTAWKQVAQLIAKLHKPKREVFAELPEGSDVDSAFDLFQNLTSDPNASLEDIAAAFDTLFPLLEASLKTAGDAVIRKARSETRKAAKEKEDGTGVTTTSNQVDIMGKRRIGLVTRAKNEVAEEQARIKQSFNDLMVSGSGRTEFIENYVKLGGTAEVGSELYDANTTLIRRQQDRRLDTEQRQAAAAAERAAENAKRREEDAISRAQEFVDKVGDKTEPRRPTSDNDTPAKAVSRFINPGKAEITLETFESQLAEFRNADGQPTFTATQVQEISARAQLARQDRQAVQSDRAKDRAESAIAQRVESAKKKRQDAIAKAQEFVNKVGDANKPSPTRPTAANDTPRKLIARYVNPRNARLAQDIFESQLSEFVNADGEPTFTPDQVQEISARAELARQDAANAKSLVASQRFEKQQADYQKELGERFQRDLARRRVSEENKSLNLFRGRSPKDPEGRSVRDILLQDYINNPERKILNQDERIAFAEEILREKTDLPEVDVKRVARSIEANLAAKINEEKLKAARPFLRTLGGKNLTRSQIEKAIRLEVLDPSNDFVTSIAALSGWEGLTAKETARLTQLQREIDQVGPLSRAGMTRVMEQARIIEAAPGLLPSTKDTVNAYIRGSIYSSIGSQLVGLSVGVWETGMSLATESLVSIGRNKGDIGATIEELVALHKGWASNLSRGVREFGRTLKTGTTYIEQVQGGQESQGKLEDQGKLEGKVFVDPLTRTYDDATKRMTAAISRYRSNPNAKDAANILYQSFRAWVLASGRFTFRMLSAVDSSFTKANAATVANIISFRRAKALGLTAQDLANVMDESQRQAEAHRAYLVNEVGLTNANEIAIEVRDHLEGAYYQALSNRGVEGLQDLINEASADIQDKIGTGETSQKTLIGKATRSVTQLIQTFPFPLAGIIPAVRTVGNVMDSLMWTAPGIGLYRAIRFNGKTTEQRNEYFPNIHADWQFRRRQALAALSNGAVLGILALLKANEDEPDDEKWFWWTGSFPALNDVEKARWQRNGWTENTLMIGPVRFQLDRGFGQTLYVPMAMSAMLYEATDGVDGKEFVQDLTSLAEMLVPGFSQGKSQFKSTESVYGMQSFATNQATALAPFSAFLKSGRRLEDRIDTKNSEASFFQLNPFYVDTDAEGVSVFRNVLGEKLVQDENGWGMIQKIGAPMFLKLEDKGRDPVKKQISEDFYANKYSGGEVTLSTFKTKLTKAGMPFSPALYKKWKTARIDAFVDQYSKQRPGILKSENYSSKVGSVWQDAGKKADRELGIKRKN